MKISREQFKKLARDGKATTEDGKPVSLRDLRPERKKIEQPDKQSDSIDINAVIKAISIFSENNEQISKEAVESIVQALNTLTEALQNKAHRRLKITKIERDVRGLMTSVEIEEISGDNKSTIH